MLPKKTTDEELKEERELNRELDAEMPTEGCQYCESARIKKTGFNHAGAIKYRCLDCGRQTSAGGRKFLIKSRARFDFVSDLFVAGHSIRYIAREAGMSKETVTKIRDLWCSKEKLKCGCGGKYGHRGWCSWRLQHSEKREAFMRKWHSTSE